MFITRKTLGILALFIALTGASAACGATPEPTTPPATPKPEIIILTPTPLPTVTVPVESSATPTIFAATATKPAPTATSSPEATEPEESPEPGEEQTQTPEPTPPVPTNTPKPDSVKYPAPVLLDPPSNRPVPWRGSLTLIWSPVGELKENEYYVVKLERRPQTPTQEWWSGEVFVKETRYVVEGNFLAPFHYSSDHGHAVVYWWVRVARKTGEDASGKPVGIDISEKSEERTLILDPKPEGE